MLSILADKDYSEMIHLICSMAEHIYIAQNESDRAASVADQMKEVNKHQVPCTACASVAEALSIALSQCTDQDVLIAGGSLYTVGEVLQAWQKHA